MCLLQNSNYPLNHKKGGAPKVPPFSCENLEVRKESVIFALSMNNE